MHGRDKKPGNTNHNVKHTLKDFGIDIAAAAGTGVAEQALFFPTDSIAKRLMNNRKVQATFGKTATAGQASIKQIVFLDAHNKSFFEQFSSLYRGAFLGFGYKISQRVIKYAGQPLIIEPLVNHFGMSAQQLLGNRNGIVAVYTTAGVFVGFAEVPFLQTIDVLKVRAQTNNQTLNYFTEVRKQGLKKSYRGAVITAYRNGLGSAFFWGSDGFIKSYKLGKSKKVQTPQEEMQSLRNVQMPLAERFACSSIASITSIAASHPFDVIRTRMLAPAEIPSISSWSMFQTIIKEQGVKEFTKGLPTKIVTTFPKGAFGLTLFSLMEKSFKNTIADLVDSSPTPEKVKPKLKNG